MCTIEWKIASLYSYIASHISLYLVSPIGKLQGVFSLFHERHSARWTDSRIDSGAGETKTMTSSKGQSPFLASHGTGLENQGELGEGEYRSSFMGTHATIWLFGTLSPSLASCSMETCLETSLLHTRWQSIHFGDTDGASMGVVSSHGIQSCGIWPYVPLAEYSSSSMFHWLLK